ncbi:MAG: HAD-IIA family hydrolase [Anaerolineales bacterium]|nr:HAD-IIA family hydrolase [Anaerolineales bacterium]
MLFRDVRACLIDMDGVLWEGNRPMPGLVEFFATLRTKRIRFILATNNASQTPEQYVNKLAGFGVTISRDDVLTSAQATALYLRGRTPDGAKVFVIGEAGLRQALTEQGFTLGELWDATAQYVVVGMDRTLSWDKLATATLNIRAGAMFIGTNPDRTIPVEQGIVHGNGAILAALQTATGVAPIVIGKPEPTMYQIAMQRLGTVPAATIAIGDRLDTDILGAVRAGLRSVLVLSGVSTRADLERSDIKPTWVMNNIQEITEHLQHS